MFGGKMNRVGPSRGNKRYEFFGVEDKSNNPRELASALTAITLLSSSAFHFSGLNSIKKKQTNFIMESTNNMIYAKEIKLFTLDHDYEIEKDTYLVLPFKLKLKESIPYSHECSFNLVKK